MKTLSSALCALAIGLAIGSFAHAAFAGMGGMGSPGKPHQPSPYQDTDRHSDQGAFWDWFDSWARPFIDPRHHENKGGNRTGSYTNGGQTMEPNGDGKP